MNDYTDEGQLLGHIVIGAQMVHDLAKEIPDFPESAGKSADPLYSRTSRGTGVRISQETGACGGSCPEPGGQYRCQDGDADRDFRTQTKAKKTGLDINRLFESNLRRTGDI